MIPKQAFFYWSGPELPWIRAQTIETFRRHHPGWRLVLGSPEDRVPPPGVELLRDDVTDPALPVAARSDVWRYHVLHAHGGLYSDLDVAFVRSTEPLWEGDHDAWITTDLGTPVREAGLRMDRGVPLRNSLGQVRWNVALSLGVLAARQGSVFYRRALELARAVRGASVDYQSHGTNLLVAHWRALHDGLSLGPVPAEAFYREGSNPTIVRRLWTQDGATFPAGELGVHWFGGSPESEPYLAARSLEDLPACWVRRALTRGSS